MTRRRMLAPVLVALVSLGVSATAAGASTYTLRPNADVTSQWPVVGASTAWDAINDNVLQPTSVGVTEYIHAGGWVGLVTEVGLTTQTLGAESPTAGRAWFYGNSGNATGEMDVHVIWGGQIRASTSIPPSSPFAWRSISITPPTQAAVDDLRIRFVSDGTSPSLGVRAAYFELTAADVTAPNTTISSAPANPTTSTSASFSFTSTESPSTFECKLDASAYSSCTSPKSYSNLSVGSHTFRVRAKDAAGNTDPTPAEHTWQISSGCDVTAQVGTTIDTPGEVNVALDPGETGCFRAGTYTATGETWVTKQGVTFRSYPGETATINGRWSLDADFVKLEGLRLNVGVATRTPGISIWQDDVTVRNNDVNGGDLLSVCIFTSANPGGPPNRLLIERNRVHDCGDTGGAYDNLLHGIYIGDGNGTIRENVIYDNEARGIQLYPNANGMTISNNTLYANGQGVLFGDNAANNAVSNNVISHSYNRWNVEAPTLWGTGNTVTSNCVFAPTGSFTSNGGIQSPMSGVSETGNVKTADPTYAGVATRDLRVTNASCEGSPQSRGAPDAVANPVGFPAA